MPGAMPQAMPAKGVEQTTQRNATDERNVRLQAHQKSSSVGDRRTPVDNEEGVVLGVAISRVIGELGRIYDGSYGRAPVNNREPRPASEANRNLRSALMLRDGGKCWMCGWDRSSLEYWESDARMVIDHLLPRSWFAAQDVHLADRSDNLAIACWSCNSVKSNRIVPFRPVLPVVWVCPTDLTEWSGIDRWGAVDNEWDRAWCDTCEGAAMVPPGWTFAALTEWGAS